jgi:dienelactone hydrolase
LANFSLLFLDCFGGTGVVDYAFTEVKDVKAVVPFHGGLTSLAPVQTEEVYPYVLIQSGGIDDAHGNNTELEMALNDAEAIWEITRYSGT